MSTDVENVCQEESLEEEKVNQKKEVKKYCQKIFAVFPQDIPADIAKLCDEETQTVEGEEVTYL